MTRQQQWILQLLDCAIDGNEYADLTDFDWGQIMALAKVQQIENLVYYGAVNCGCDQQAQMHAFKQQTYRYLLVDHYQLQQLKKILDAFDANGIHYMPLKGILLKNLYPKTDMRLMGDADLLIKMDQYDRIKTIMEQLGCQFLRETDHELIWQTPWLQLELHKRLIPSYNYDYAAYYGDGWQLGHPLVDNPCCFVMTDEDQMVYLFTHFAKHYRDGGIGIRHMLDIYVYRKVKPQLDENYIAQELDKLQLLAFYQNILHTLAVWFQGDEPDKMSDLITNWVFSSGRFGTYQSRTVAQGIRNQAKYKDTARNARIKTVGRLIFLPYEIMCEKYPVLRCAPMLLPVMWVVRWGDALMRKPKVIKKHCKRVKLLEENELNVWEKHLNVVGLAFRFEEK